MRWLILCGVLLFGMPSVAQQLYRPVPSQTVLLDDLTLDEVGQVTLSKIEIRQTRLEAELLAWTRAVRAGFVTFGIITLALVLAVTRIFALSQRI